METTLFTTARETADWNQKQEKNGCLWAVVRDKVTDRFVVKAVTGLKGENVVYMPAWR